MSRPPMDTWAKREQLCLASAVSCSGDQNWITVSRTLKSVCGNGNNRPADWYSQKNCAVQYGHLLETVETTKRKKRTNESSSGFSSPSNVTVETPTELLLRRLTDERMIEIKTQMRRDQELYCKVQREIEALQSDEMSEQQLQQMWQEIEKEQETKRIDEMKLENRMREREQRKKEMVGSWRNNSNARRSNVSADTTAVDMEVEDMAGGATNPASNKQAAAPAPLLTSLLKSPGSSNSGNNATSPTSTSAPTASVARATAPTITSLLTSGTNAIPNQPAIIMKSPSDTAFISRPISGPPTVDVTTTGRSPSQAAPTLSMLLEKKQQAAATAAPKANEAATKTGDAIPNSTDTPAVAGDQESQDTANADTLDVTEADEEQLLEVFKNMDDIIDDLDIDMASVIDEDILKDVDNVVDSPADASAKPDVIDFEDKLDALKREDPKAKKSPIPKSVDVVIGSSDDSNDNIPLAEVATQESKERTTEGSNTPSVPLSSEVAVEELSESITIISSSSEDNVQEMLPTAVAEPTKTVGGIVEITAVAEQDAKLTESGKELEQTAASTTTESTAVTTSSQDSEKPLAEPTAEITSEPKHDTDEESSSQTDSSKVDEPIRSSAKSKQHNELKHESDASVITRQTPPRSGPNITTAPAPLSARAPLLRKLPHRDRSESPMVDDDTTTASDQSTVRSSTRRRCSSTPVIDSIPNSPASSEPPDERRETRAAAKKLFLGIYNTLLESKHSTCFRRAFHDEHTHKQADCCLRPMDLPSLKRNIDTGHIRHISELQRDVLLMCHNLLLIYKPHTPIYKSALLFMQECRALKEFAALPESSTALTTSNVTPKPEKEKTPGGNKARSGSRKSQRHH
ncbi:Brd8 [Drosophila busckii]|uniref:Brd8 n=1 Tax=Drosophila busckii TaxID=30019 RepID=A0A0M4ENG6_DROBS|nr:bromodomain-containing protein 8 [Drosophila busckii]ALC47152.1 Brd8 [Drosophila busckii]